MEQENTLKRKREEKVKWTRQSISTLIEIFKNKPCLYNVKSIDYRNRERVRDAQEEMTNTLKKIIPDITAEDCIKKYRSLRDQFRRDFVKFEASKNKSGAGTDEIIEPKLWCYEELLFLRDHVKQKEGQIFGITSRKDSETDDNQDTQELEDAEEMIIEYLDDDEEILSPYQQGMSSSGKNTPTSCTPRSSTLKKSRAGPSQKNTDVTEVLCTYLKDKTKNIEHKEKKEKDRAELFAEYVAKRLRNLKSAKNRVKAETEINNVLSKYELDELSD